jgi:hypothetical protein
LCCSSYAALQQIIVLIPDFLCGIKAAGGEPAHMGFVQFEDP